MKNLTKYISHMKDLHSLNEYLNEKLVINKDFVDTELAEIKATDDNLFDVVVAEVHKQSGKGQSRLHPINLNHIDVSEIAEMSCLFDAVNDEVTLRYIDISEWDVHNVERMKWMFCDCKELISVGDLSNWDVGKLEDAEGMFQRCKKLEYIGNISKWDPESLKNYGVNDMFIGCQKLKGNVGNLSAWNVSPVILQKLRIQGIL